MGGNAMCSAEISEGLANFNGSLGEKDRCGKPEELVSSQKSSKPKKVVKVVCDNTNKVKSISWTECEQSMRDFKAQSWKMTSWKIKNQRSKREMEDFFADFASKEALKRMIRETMEVERLQTIFDKFLPRCLVDSEDRGKGFVLQKKEVDQFLHGLRSKCSVDFTSVDSFDACGEDGMTLHLRLYQSMSSSLQRCCPSKEKYQNHILWEFFSNGWVRVWMSCPDEWLLEVPSWLSSVWEEISQTSKLFFASKVSQEFQVANRQRLADQLISKANDSFLVDIRKYRPAPNSGGKGKSKSEWNRENADENLVVFEDGRGWGGRLLFYHCVHARDQQALELLAVPPAWLADPALLSPQRRTLTPLSLEPAWVSFLLDEGGLPLVLDLDSADGGAPPLFPVVRKLLFAYMNAVKRAQPPAWLSESKDLLVQWTPQDGFSVTRIDTGKSHFRSFSGLLAQFLRIVLRVPEVTSPTRVRYATEAVSSLLKYPAAIQLRVLADSPPGAEDSPLGAALSTCREAVVGAIVLGATNSLLHQPASTAAPEWPLNRLAASIAYPAGSLPAFECIKSVFSEDGGVGGKALPVFSMAGLDWDLCVVPTARRSCADVATAKEWPTTVVLRLLGPVLPNDIRVQVSIDVEEHLDSADDVSPKAVRVECIFSAARDFNGPIALLSPGSWARLQMRARYLEGGRRMRTAGERAEEQRRVLELMVEHGADVDRVEEGHSAWSLCLGPHMDQRILALLAPRNIAAALDLAFGRESLNATELGCLIKLVPEGSEASMDVCRLIGNPEMVNETPSSPSPQALLEFFCKRGCVTGRWKEAVGSAVEQRDWGSLGVLMSHVPKGKSLAGVCTHSLVLCKQPDMLNKVLVLGASVDATHPSHDMLTALHLAARNCDLDSVQILLEHRASCSVRHPGSGFTALHEACQSSKQVSTHRAAVVALLLEHGADPRALSARRQEPSHLTNSKEVRLLLEKHISSSRNIGGRSIALPAKAAEKPVQKLRGSSVCNERRSEGKPETSWRNGNSTSDQENAKSRTQAMSMEERVKNTLSAIDSIPNKSIHPAEHREESAGSVSRWTSSDTTKSIVPVPDPCAKSPGHDSHLTVDSDVNMHIHEPTVNTDSSPTVIGSENFTANVASIEDAGNSSALFGFVTNAWDLRFTREFKDQLFGLHNQPVLLRSLIENLRELASGVRRKSLMKMLKGTPKALRIFESPCKTFADGPRFLWQYAVDYSPRVKCFTDTIRLWRICLQHDDVPKAIEFIVSSHKRGRTSNHRRHLKPISAITSIQGGRRIPRTYQPADGVLPDTLKENDEIKFEALNESELEEEEDEASLEPVVYTPPAVAAADSFNVLKFYALNEEVAQSLLRTIGRPSAVDSLEFPFIPDDREDRLIQMDQKTSSILLVGRSGTGKTSIALGRMWSLYKKWHTTYSAPVEFDGISTHYHQIFVTANRVLRDQVRKSFNGMKQGFGDTSLASASNYPASFRDVSEDLFPLFLTQSEWLQMIDGTLEEPFFPRNSDGSVVGRIEGGFHEEVGMLDEIPDDDGWTTGEDEDEFDDDNDDEIDRTPYCNTDGITGSKCVRKLGKEVDFPFFRDEIWPKLISSKRQATKELSASALFQEIHSYIKGSHLSLRTDKGFLSREEYLYLSQKMAPNFRGLSGMECVDDLPGDRRGHRDLVYDLFLEYESEKRKIQAYDISDAVFHIWKQLQRSPYAGVPLHSMFVDEVQDFTPAELKLFIHICSDKNDLFFSGDTCQTIASGVGFRFEDLKCLFKEEQDLCKPQADFKPALAIAVPNVTVLSVNYRTHSGILSTAAGIVDLLQEFFRDTIDVLPRESGFFQGPKPVLLMETKVDVATILIVGSDKKSSQIEFGAHQVILVRNQEAKKSLPAEFDGCLAMTVLESKGLEFDDVFLWNFFADSRAGKEWRIVLNFLTAGNNLEEITALQQECDKTVDREVLGMLRPLPFDPYIHQILREELKHLYTAITRARVRVVIYDRDEVKRAPMFHFLRRRDLVQTLSLLNGVESESCTPMTVQTQPEEWRRRGLNLKESGMHQLAAMCFRNAGDEALEAEADGEFQASVAKKLHGKERQLSFFAAGESFVRGGNLEKAARCFFESSYHELAGNVYMKCSNCACNESDADTLARHAFTCFRKAGKLIQAVDVLVQQKKIKGALKILKDVGEYDAAISVIDSNESFTPPADLSLGSFLKLAAASHPAVQALKGGAAPNQVHKASFLRLLGRMQPEDEINILKKYPSLIQELTNKLVASHRHAEAASIMEENGEVIKAASILVDMDSPQRNELLLAVDLYVRHGLTNGRNIEYLDKAKQILQGIVNKKTEKELKSANLDHCQLLQLELLMAEWTLDFPERERLLSGIIGEAKKRSCLIAEALAVCVLNIDRLSSPKPTTANRVNDLDSGISLLSELVKRLNKHQEASGEVLMSENFFGAVRAGGSLRVRRGRKILLDAMLGGLEKCPVKDGYATIKLDDFHFALRRRLLGMRLDLTLRLSQELDVRMAQSTGKSLGTLSDALLKVWALDAGTRFLREFKALSKNCNDTTPLEMVFGEQSWIRSCSLVEAVVCPDGQSLPVASFDEALPKKRQMGCRKNEISCSLAKYSKFLQKHSKTEPLSVFNLSRSLQILRWIGYFRDMTSTLSEISNGLSECGHAAVASNSCEFLGQNSVDDSFLRNYVSHLISGLHARQQGNFLLEAEYALLYLHHHLRASSFRGNLLPVDAWAAVHGAVAEAVLSLTLATRTSYNAILKGGAQDSAIVILFPGFLARRLLSSAVRRRVTASQNASCGAEALVSALQLTLQLFAASPLAPNSEALRQLSGMLWVILANMVVAADPGEAGTRAAHHAWPQNLYPRLQALATQVQAALPLRFPGHWGHQGGGQLESLLEGGSPVVASPSQLYSALASFGPTNRLVAISVSRERAGPGKPTGCFHFVLSEGPALDTKVLSRLDAAATRGLAWIKSQSSLDPKAGEFIPLLDSGSNLGSAPPDGSGAQELEKDAGAFRRSAAILIRFVSYCRFRCMLRKLVTRQRPLASTERVMQVSGGNIEKDNMDSEAFGNRVMPGSHHLDPYNRAWRYQMFRFQRLDRGAGDGPQAGGQLFSAEGLMNLNEGVILLKDSEPGYEVARRNLACFRAAYESSMLPLLLRLDSDREVLTWIHKLHKQRILHLQPMDEVFLDDILRDVVGADQSLTSALDCADKALWWPEKPAPPGDAPEPHDWRRLFPSLAQILEGLELNVLPRAESFGQSLFGKVQEALSSTPIHHPEPVSSPELAPGPQPVEPVSGIEDDPVGDQKQGCTFAPASIMVGQMQGPAEMVLLRDPGAGTEDGPSSFELAAPTAVEDGREPEGLQAGNSTLWSFGQGAEVEGLANNLVQEPFDGSGLSAPQPGLSALAAEWTGRQETESQSIAFGHGPDSTLSGGQAAFASHHIAETEGNLIEKNTATGLETFKCSEMSVRELAVTGNLGLCATIGMDGCGLDAYDRTPASTRSRGVVNFNHSSRTNDRDGVSTCALAVKGPTFSGLSPDAHEFLPGVLGEKVCAAFSPYQHHQQHQLGVQVCGNTQFQSLAGAAAGLLPTPQLLFRVEGVLPAGTATTNLGPVWETSGQLPPARSPFLATDWRQGEVATSNQPQPQSQQPQGLWLPMTASIMPTPPIAADPAFMQHFYTVMRLDSCATAGIPSGLLWNPHSSLTDRGGVELPQGAGGYFPAAAEMGVRSVSSSGLGGAVKASAGRGKAKGGGPYHKQGVSKSIGQPLGRVGVEQAQGCGGAAGLSNGNMMAGALGLAGAADAGPGWSATTEGCGGRRVRRFGKDHEKVGNPPPSTAHPHGPQGQQTGQQRRRQKQNQQKQNQQKQQVSAQAAESPPASSTQPQPSSPPPLHAATAASGSAGRYSPGKKGSPPRAGRGRGPPRGGG